HGGRRGRKRCAITGPNHDPEPRSRSFASESRSRSGRRAPGRLRRQPLAGVDARLPIAAAALGLSQPQLHRAQRLARVVQAALAHPTATGMVLFAGMLRDRIPETGGRDSPRARAGTDASASNSDWADAALARAD